MINQLELFQYDESAQLVPYEYEGDFYFNKSPMPFLALTQNRDAIWKKIQFKGSSITFQVVDTFRISQDLYAVCLQNIKDRTSKALDYLDDELYYAEQWADEDGNYFEPNVEKLSDTGRDMCLMGWNLAFKKIKLVIEKFRGEEA